MAGREFDGAGDGWDPGELSAQFARQPDDVLLTGDSVRNGWGTSDGTVEYFVCGRIDRGEPREVDDKAVIADPEGEGAHDLSLVEATAMRTGTTGKRPILRLPAERVQLADEAIAKSLEEQLLGNTVPGWKKGRRVSLSARELLDAVSQNGYDVWITGGLVREAVRTSNAPTAAPRQSGDLDLVGSIPPGAFSERIRRFAGRAELPRRLNPLSGVVAVLDETKKERFIEYAPLRQEIDDGDSTLRYGCEPEADAQWRDLTINTLCYDWRHRLLIDPTGRGIEDVLALRLRPPGPPRRWPGFLAKQLFRFFKFMTRWPDADAEGLGEFVNNHFAEIREDLSTVNRNELIRLARPFGVSPEERLERLLALGGRMAPSLAWADLLAPLGNGEN